MDELERYDPLQKLGEDFFRFHEINGMDGYGQRSSSAPFTSRAI